MDFIKKVTSNKTNRCFTFEMESGIKLRTVKLTKEEFEEDLKTSIEEWQSFLETDKENYYIVSRP